MKAIKIFVILLVTLFSGVTKSQTYDVKFDNVDMYRTYQPVTGDTIKGTASISKVFKVSKSFGYNYDLQFAADSLTDGGSCNIVIYGSIDGTKYYSLHTTSWKMATADTSILYSSSAAVRYNYIKATMTGVGSTTRAKLGKLHLSLSR